MLEKLSSKRVFAAAVSVIAFLGLALALGACTSSDSEVEAVEGASSPATIERVNMVLASTTSTQDSGLFDALIPAFEDAHPEVNVQVIAVGSGEAMEMGRRGDADLLFVHSPAAEITFMEEGYGLERRPVMYNDFIIIGPEADPAEIRDVEDAATALARIAEAESPFISRGDDSGTHARELSVWEIAGIAPGGDWYTETGQGMGATLQIADEFQAYTLTDRSTYLNLSLEGVVEMPILNEGSNELLNFYHVITLVDAREQTAAQAFADWIISPAGQEVIASFGVEQFKESLFAPNAD